MSIFIWFDDSGVCYCFNSSYCLVGNYFQGRLASCRNQLIDFHCKAIVWFLYGVGCYWSKFPNNLWLSCRNLVCSFNFSIDIINVCRILFCIQHVVWLLFRNISNYLASMMPVNLVQYAEQFSTIANLPISYHIKKYLN